MKLLFSSLLIILLTCIACRKDPQINEDGLLFLKYAGEYDITEMEVRQSNFWSTPTYNGVQRTFIFEGNSGTEERRIVEYIMNEDHTFEHGWKDTINKDVQIIEANLELKRDCTYTYNFSIQTEFEGGTHIAPGKFYDCYNSYSESGIWFYKKNLDRINFTPQKGIFTSSYQGKDLASGEIEQHVVVTRTTDHEEHLYLHENRITGETFTSTDHGVMFEKYALTFTPTSNGYSVKNYSQGVAGDNNRLSELGMYDIAELWKLNIDMTLERR